jgi:hypothetical protein
LTSPFRERSTSASEPGEGLPQLAAQTCLRLNDVHGAPYIADFACLAARLIVGSDDDKRRYSYLARHGWRVLRSWNPDVLSNTEGVLEMIRLALLEQQESVQPPSPSRL